MSEGKLGSCGDAGVEGGRGKTGVGNMIVDSDLVLIATPGYCWFLLDLLYMKCKVCIALA